MFGHKVLVTPAYSSCGFSTSLGALILDSLISFPFPVPFPISLVRAIPQLELIDLLFNLTTNPGH
jgi:hypothetical protein